MSGAHAEPQASSPDVSLLSEDDLYWFNEGTHRRLGDKLGAHIRPGEASRSRCGPPTPRGWRSSGTSTTGTPTPMCSRRGAARASGRGPRPAPVPGTSTSSPSPPRAGDVLEKADPFARRAESRPRTGSVVWDLAYEWGDEAWMQTRGARIALECAHLGLRGAPGQLAPRSRATRGASSATPRWRSR